VRADQAARDVLPGHPLARHIDDFLTDLANANRPRNTIRAYRGDLIAFAAHHDGDITDITAAPVRAFLGAIAGQVPGHPQAQRAAVSGSGPDPRHRPNPAALHRAILKGA
jgi:integrase/recombinase XerD